MATSPSSRPRPRFRRVLVITGDHGRPDPTKWDGRYSEEDLELHRAMREALESLPGYRFEFLSRHDQLLDRLHRDPPEFVLNLCDTGLYNVATRELHVPALLEAAGIPYSGAPPAGMVLCYDKSVVRLVAQSHGVPVPGEVYLPPATPIESVRPTYPALIKPAQGDGSVGITRQAVVRSRTEAAGYLQWLRGQLPDAAALIQEYLPGPEYGLALLGNPGFGLRALPPLTVDFSELPPELPPILAFESKTGPETPYSRVRIERARLDDGTLEELCNHAELLFGRLHCRDYARFDFRTGADGRIKLMEVNPNPAWSCAAKLAIMAGFGGLTYPQLLESILEAAQARLA